MEKTKIVNFKVTRLLDFAKQGSDVTVGAVLTGTFNGTNKVYYTDDVATDWVFYVGETCEIYL